MPADQEDPRGAPPSDHDAQETPPGASASSSGLGADHLRLLFDHMLEGYAYCRMISDERRQPDDFVYIDVNPAFGELTGLHDVVGKRVTEIIPDIKETNPEVLATYDRVTRTGQPERFEVDLAQLGIVLNVSVFRPEPDHFVAVFEDVTERVRAEKKVEELVRFLEYRVEQRSHDLAEALRIVNRPPGGDTTPGVSGQDR